MNIKPPVSTVTALNAYNNKVVGKRASETDAPTSASTNVALSAESQALLGADQDIDVAKVQAIRQALANGTLKINPDRIAEGLLRSAMDLIKR